MGSLRQTNFSAGELAPGLWARTDLPIFTRGTRTMRNFFPTRNGAAVSRPGTAYVAGSKFVTAPDLGDREEGQCRLIPFIAGDDRAFVCEFGKNYIRFFTNGGVVETMPGSGVPYEVATPYTVADIAAMQWAQVGDVLTLCTPNWDPYELRLIAFSPPSILFQKARMVPYSPYFTDVEAPNTPTVNYALVRPKNWAPGTTYLEGSFVVNGGKVYEALNTGDSAGAGGPLTESQDITDNTVHWRFRFAANNPSSTRPAKEWQWLFTAVVRDKTTGAIYETLGEKVSKSFDGNPTGAGYDASENAIDDLQAVYADMPLMFRRSETALLLSTPEGYNTYEVIAYNAYRGAGDLFGFIGQTKTREFVDLGNAPDYTNQPPLGGDHFGTETEATGVAAPFDKRKKDRPRCVGFFQGKRIFGGLTRFPMQLVTSKTGDYVNNDARLSHHVAGEALKYELASLVREEIRSMLTLERLLVFTNAAPWNVGGQQGSPLDFDSIAARPLDRVGARHVPALLVDKTALFVRAKGTGVRALLPQGEEISSEAIDITVAAEHLFVGKDRAIKEWCYAEDPWGLVWAVRDDGMLLSLTYARGSWGWARHDTQGIFESVCAVPEGEEDAVYVVVVRTIAGGKRRYIERMTSRVRRSIYWDPDTQETKKDPNGGATFNGALLASPPDDICLDSAIAYCGAATSSIPGLTHLAGKKVWVIGPNMDPLADLTVSAAGVLNLGGTLAANVNTGAGPRLLVYVGLLYYPDLETLAAAGGDRLRKKTVDSIGFEVDQSRGLLVGQDFDHLAEWEQRTAEEDGYNSIGAESELVEQPVEGKWDLHARAALRQSLPLPVTLTGLTRGVSGGE